MCAQVRQPSRTQPFNIGDQLQSLEGILEYDFGQYSVRHPPSRILYVRKQTECAPCWKCTQGSQVKLVHTVVISVI
jgi:hypothetical protein